jgi:hypothetical protein
MPRNQKTDNYALSVLYKLTRPDCKKAYVGQTGQSFSTRNKHKYAFWNNNYTFKFALHHIEQAYSFDTIHNTMQVLQYHMKSAHLNTIERYYILVEHAANNRSNDSRTIFPNAIFDTLPKADYP